jgi:hypothetical protein
MIEEERADGVDQDERADKEAKVEMETSGSMIYSAALSYSE